MLTFKYKDMRVRYTYMLSLASLYLLNTVFSIIHITQTASPGMYINLAFNSILAIPVLLLVYISLRALGYKVEFTDNTVMLNSTSIELAQIDRIKFNEVDLSYTVQYGYSKSHAVKMGKRESDEDISTFRQAMRELLSRTKLANSNAKISQDTVRSTTPGTKVYEQADESVREEKAKLAGIGGWLIYILFFLLDGVLLYIMDITAKRPAIPLNGHFGILLYYIFCASIALFAVFALVLLFLKKKMFQKVFIAFLAYSLVAERIVLALQYALIDGKWPGIVGIINGFAIGVIYNVVWILAWRAYFQRSIRVKNTFQ